ncbi:hypothetical protein L9F63_008900, partial [Diploptera punctata]
NMLRSRHDITVKNISENYVTINDCSAKGAEIPTVPRGNKKIGDKCEDVNECGFDGAVCTGGDKKITCQCRDDLRASNHIDKCGKKIRTNGNECKASGAAFQGSMVFEKKKKAFTCLKLYPCTNLV